MTRETVLLVEDNPDDEELALWALGKIGVDVDVARTGAEAVERLLGPPAGAVRPAPDLVILDLKLPRMTGLEVLELLRSDPRTRELAVVVCTSSEDPRDLSACHRLGVLAVLPKPLRGDAIRRLLEGRWGTDVRGPGQA